MKILIVDDSVEFRNIVSRVALIDGHTVETAGDGVEALKVYNKFQPHMVLSDINMPKMNGIELLKKIRRINPETIVVMITGHSKIDYVIESLRHGAQNYISKPCDLVDILQLFRKYGAMVKDRTIELELWEMVAHKYLDISFPSKLGYVPYVVNYLMAETGQTLPIDSRLGIKMGLMEIITNALEHGNLEISYEEKRAAATRGLTCLEELYSERQQDLSLTKRVVRVEYQLGPDDCTWTISDQGPGFSVEDVLDPTAHDNLEAPLGRGIFIARLQFDTVEYLGVGNRVVLTKRRDHVISEGL